MRGKNLSGLEVTPAMIHVRHATKIASEVTEGYFICDDLPCLPHLCCIILLRLHLSQSLSLLTTVFFNLRSVSLSPDSPHHRPLIIMQHPPFSFFPLRDLLVEQFVLSSICID